MAKNLKKSKVAMANGSASAASTDETQSAAKAAPRAKRSGGSIRKATASEKPKRAVSRKKTTPAATTISDNEIRLRAYFISQWRTQNGIGGDSGQDWLEARRQLEAEAAQRA